ncbi:MAG: phosphoglycerate dehydrogenase [Leptolyngbyaceae cyanobacterium]
MKVLITCPPMLGCIEEFIPLFAAKGIEVDCPEVIQTLSVDALKSRLPQYDGWIIGDDPANADVLRAGHSGRLRAAVKWGVGVDNVDFMTAESLGMPISNTPGMFGAEVADIAMGYVTGLARQTFAIDRAVRDGQWIKPAGISLSGKTVALVGFGDIGRQLAKRLLTAEMKVIVYDPELAKASSLPEMQLANWPEKLDMADFLILTCSLNAQNRHMLNSQTLEMVKKGVRIVNVARGPLIDETSLIKGLISGQVCSAALDVFETEPLPLDSPIRQFEQCIFGTHNASNTIDAVRRTSYRAISLLFEFLGVS